MPRRGRTQTAGSAGPDSRSRVSTGCGPVARSPVSAIRSAAATPGSASTASSAGSTPCMSDRTATRTERPGLAEFLAGREQVLAGADDPGRHGGLAGLSPRARIVGLLVTHTAVDLQHAVVVDEHVTGHGAGERVLGVGGDVHLHHAVGDRLADLLERGARAAVEHQVERRRLAIGSTHAVLDLLQDRTPELDVPRLVDPVHVAERRAENVPAPLTQP